MSESQIAKHATRFYRNKPMEKWEVEEKAYQALEDVLMQMKELDGIILRSFRVEARYLRPSQKCPSSLFVVKKLEGK